MVCMIMPAKLSLPPTFERDVSVKCMIAIEHALQFSLTQHVIALHFDVIASTPVQWAHKVTRQTVLARRLYSGHSGHAPTVGPEELRLVPAGCAIPCTATAVF